MFGSHEPAPPTLQELATENAIANAMRTSGYYDQNGNRRESNTFDAKMLSILMDCPMPDKESDFEDYIKMLKIVIDQLPRIPNVDMAFYREVVRDFEDISAEARSEGCATITAVDMMKMIIRLRAIMPAGGQFEMIGGLTPVSAAITTRSNNETSIKIPQQADKPSGGTFGSGFFGFGT